MPKFRVTGPDGAAYDVTAPDGATPDAVMAMVQQQHGQGSASAASTVANDAITKGAQNFNSGASFLDNVNAGAGKAFHDLGQGIEQKLGLASNDDVKESRRLDATLMKTGGGKVGNIGANVAMVAPAALIPGAATVPGAAVIGGVIGALQPSASTGEAFLNTGMGAAGGAAGQAIANKAAGSVAFQEAQNVAKTAAGAQKAQAGKSASDAGYGIPPEDLGQGGGMFTKVLSGTGGKIKTAQVASERNQSVTNDLARQALNMADGAPINAPALAAIRTEAGKAYDVVKGSGTVTADAAYTTALDKIAQQATTAAQAFPGAVKSDIPALIKGLKEPSFGADGAVEMTKILRADADKAFAAGDKGLGKATKDAADALESMLERHLQAQGLPDALKAFQDARQTIAKTYTVQKATNNATGDVSAQVLAKLADKGKPLSGGLETIAQAGQAFPKATQMLKEAPKSLSPLDVAFAASHAAGGNWGNLLSLGVRPAARSMLLSNAMQRNALQSAVTPEEANMLTRILANKGVMLPAGVVSGVNGSNAMTQALNR